MTKTPEELTSDWKAGKLERGLYWVRFKGKIVIAECTVFGNVSKPFEIEIKTDFMIKISKVLAPVPSYDHFVELTEKAEKYDRIKVNGNYSDKISRLKSRIKYLLDLQTNNIDEEIERLRRENEFLIKNCGPFNGKIETVFGIPLQSIKTLDEENNDLRKLLKECAEYIVADIEFREDEGAMYCCDILTRISAVLGESEE